MCFTIRAQRQGISQLRVSPHAPRHVCDERLTAIRADILDLAAAFRSFGFRWGTSSRDLPYSRAMSVTRIERRVNAPREAVYRALLDPQAVASWMVPDGMTSQVHAFDPREGGAFRISLTYAGPSGTGKTTAQTDTYHGRFVKLVPNEQVVEALEFETDNPALQGEMTITFTLTDADGGTDILGVHEGLPSGVPTVDNELGWRMALAKLAALVESTSRH
jgi:uncharacterized protein YndB with AHSA1/START domain